jgi:hypothetical protein
MYELVNEKDSHPFAVVGIVGVPNVDVGVMDFVLGDSISILSRVE